MSSSHYPGSGGDNRDMNPYGSWFYYWKTSASLWKEKISGISSSRASTNYLYIPFNWGAHCDDGGALDLGSKTSETNLVKLFQIALECGRLPKLFIPIGPCPFLVNGGLPSILARNSSVDENGINRVCLGDFESINKIHSFFDPRVFKSFQVAIESLSNEFRNKNVDIEIFGLRSNFSDLRNPDSENLIQNFFEDDSGVFQKGFGRFLSKNEKSIDSLSMKEASLAKWEYQQLISSLYEETISEFLDRFWSGVVNGIFVGGSPFDFFERIEGSGISGEQIKGITKLALKNRMIPMMHLLNQGEVNKGLYDFCDECFDHSYLESFRESVEIDTFEDDIDQVVFTPLELYDLYLPKVDDQNVWGNIGLISYFESRFPQTFSFHKTLNRIDADDFFTEKIQFFSGKELKDGEVSKIIKTFLNGMEVIFDINGLSEEQKKRIDLFVLENNLQAEEIKFLTDLTFIELGQGKILIFDGAKLEGLSLKQWLVFWEKALSLFEKHHLSLSEDGDLVFSWKKRAPNSRELNFEQVRKLVVFNPTSYKKKMEIKEHKNFKLLRFDEIENSNVKSIFGNVEIILKPNGIASVEFGFFE